MQRRLTWRMRGTLRLPAMVVGVAIGLLSLAGQSTAAQIDLGPEEQIEAYGTPILVAGYSVPSFAHWNEDGLPDLIVSEGSGSTPDARVRVYLNVGTPEAPRFEGHLFAQSEDWDLTVPGGG